VVYQGVEMRDLYHLLINHFQQLFWVLWYVIAQIILGIHLSHGIASAFQSLGLYHPHYSPFVKKLSCLAAMIFVVGFSSIPIWAYLTGGH
jgi:succinate dehydrogenase / fumarate reductase cytochrome b subunit